MCLILKYVTYLQLQQTKATDIGEYEQETKVIEDAAEKASLDDVSPPSSQATKFLRRSSSSAASGGRRASRDSFFGRLSIGGYTNDATGEAAAADEGAAGGANASTSSPNGEGAHLFVLHHGFHGSSYDLRLIRSYILLLFPNAMVMASQVNEDNSEVRPVIQPFSRSVVQSFSRSAVQSFSRSVVQCGSSSSSALACVLTFTPSLGEHHDDGQPPGRRNSQLRHAQVPRAHKPGQKQPDLVRRAFSGIGGDPRGPHVAVARAVPLENVLLYLALVAASRQHLHPLGHRQRGHMGIEKAPESAGTYGSRHRTADPPRRHASPHLATPRHASPDPRNGRT